MACIVEKSSEYNARKLLEAKIDPKSGISIAAKTERDLQAEKEDMEDLEDAIMSAFNAGDDKKDIAVACGVSPQKVAAVIKKNTKA